MIQRFQSDHVTRDKKKVPSNLNLSPEQIKDQARKSSKAGRRSHLEDVQVMEEVMQRSQNEMDGDSNFRSAKSSRLNSQNHSVIEEHGTFTKPQRPQPASHRIILEKQQQDFEDFFFGSAGSNSNIETTKRIKSKSIMQERSATASFIDPTDYYKKYNDDGDNSQSHRDLHADLAGECYLGFSKLLQFEYRLYEKRDSNILHNKMSASYKNQSSFNNKNHPSLKQNTSFKARADASSFSMNEQSIRMIRGFKGEKKPFKE